MHYRVPPALAMFVSLAQGKAAVYRLLPLSPVAIRGLHHAARAQGRA